MGEMSDAGNNPAHYEHCLQVLYLEYEAEIARGSNVLLCDQVPLWHIRSPYNGARDEARGSNVMLFEAYPYTQEDLDNEYERQFFESLPASFRVHWIKETYRVSTTYQMTSVMQNLDTDSAFRLKAFLRPR